MPTELFARLDLDKIYPPFLERVLQLAAVCQDQGHVYFATQGYRSAEEQLALWQRGRSVAGAVVAPGKVVTYKKWGLHNCGLAVDFTKDCDVTKVGLQPSWKAQDYEFLATQAEALGLEAGGHWRSFKDWPHVQAPLSRHGIKTDALRRIEQIHGLAAVWAFLDKNPLW